MQMIKTKLLTQIDTCLKQYVDDNNTRYKRNITSIFMDKQQLKNFYYDMQEQKKQKLFNNMHKISKNKTLSYLNTEEKGINWRSANSIKMNKNPLITNYNEPKQKHNRLIRRKQSILQRNVQGNDQNRLQIRPNRQKYGSVLLTDQFNQLSDQYELFTKQLFLQFYQSNAERHGNLTQTPNNQYDKQQVQKIKKIQEEKYIGKYKFKMGKKQPKNTYNPSDLITNMEMIEMQQNKHKKINGCLRKMIQNYSPSQNRYGIKQIQALREQKNKKQAISKAITQYFVKKNRYYPSF